jgi:hypothetical protein
MRPNIVRTHSGKYEVKYDIAECYEYWSKEGKAPPECCHCVLHNGHVAIVDTEQEAKRLVSLLPDCPGLPAKVNISVLKTD